MYEEEGQPGRSGHILQGMGTTSRGTHCGSRKASTSQKVWPSKTSSAGSPDTSGKDMTCEMCSDLL